MAWDPFRGSIRLSSLSSCAITHQKLRIAGEVMLGLLGLQPGQQRSLAVSRQLLEQHRDSEDAPPALRRAHTLEETGMTAPAGQKGGRAPKAKGSRFEREAVRILAEHGFAAEKVPLSGSAGGKWSGDISVPIDGIDRPIEAKVRNGGFRRIYAWLAGRFAVIAKADRQEALITLRLADFAEIAARAERGSNGGRSP